MDNPTTQPPIPAAADTIPAWDGVPRLDAWLGSQGVRLVRRPFETDPDVCNCGALDKDDCACIRDTKRSYIASATSGDARSSKTACAAIHATSSVSVTKTAASRKSFGMPLFTAKCLSKGFSVFMGVLSKFNVIGKSHCNEETDAHPNQPRRRP